MSASPPVVFVVAVLVAAAVTLLITRLPTVRAQIAALAAACAVLPLVAVMSTGVLMLERKDAVMLMLAAVVAGAIVVVCGLFVGGRVARHVSRLRQAPQAIRDGDLAARAMRGGPRETDDVAGAINAMADRLNELLDTRSTLVMWLGHDLRTPLASLRAMTEAIEDGLATPQEYLPAIQQRVRDLGRMVDDLFELARLDAGGAAMEMVNGPIGPLVADTAESRRVEAERAEVTLTLRVADDLPSVLHAPASVRRVVDNLVGNALRHAPAGGRVAVDVQPDGTGVRVSVTDDGAGIDEATRARMFEPFWRADPARAADASGAGLGLAIARSLVDGHGGRIWADPLPEGGTRVAFTLPAADSSVASATSASPDATRATA